MSDPKVRFPFWIKILLFGVLLAVPPTVFLGISSLGKTETVIKAESRELRLAISEDIANVIALTTKDAENTVVGVAGALGDATIPPDQKLAVVRLLITASDVVDHAVVYGPDGKFIDAIETDKNTYKPGEDPLDKGTGERANRDEVGYGKVVGGKSPRLQLVVPIRADGNVTGFVGTFFPLGSIQTRLVSSAVRLPDSPDSLWVIDLQKTIIAHIDPTKIGQTLDHPLTSDPALFQDNGVAQTGEVEGASGIVLSSVKPLPHLPWVVGAQVPVEKAYASYYALQKLVITTIVALIIIALLLSFFFARFITRPITRLVAFAKSLADRDFTKSTGVTSADELGVLSHALEGAAKDLDSSEKQIKREIEIRADLRRFLPDHLVEGVVNREASLELGGERREITVLFADVVSFTQVCEDHDPEAIVTILNELFTILTEIVFRHGGTVDKFIGDCVMAFWGAPEAADNHGYHALSAAEDMIRWIEIGNDTWEKRYGVVVELAIGVHSGDAVVGNIGSSTRMEYTAIGSTVNIAARLEALARPNQILSTSTTKRACEETFTFVELKEETISSGGEKIAVFEVAL